MMEKVRCLLVDDEEPARKLIRSHLSDLEEFEIIASLDNAFDALVFLQKHTIDLIFLDVRLPRMTGLELMSLIKTDARIILTTAYREYGADAFDLNAFDYLVKPITQERFMKAIAKFKTDRAGKQQIERTTNDADFAYIFLKVGREQVKVFLKDILYIEALADYIKVYTTDRSYIASERLGYMEEKLPVNSFIRIHRSFIIAVDKITSYKADEVMLQNKTLPLGRLYKSGFLKMVDKRSI